MSLADGEGGVARAVVVRSTRGEVVVEVTVERREVEESGLAPAALGATILRTETSPVVAASLVLHLLGRLG